MITLSTAAGSRANDRAAIDGGIPSAMLMERAAEGIFSVIKKHCLLKGKAAVICGNGNNGGDGFALAAILDREGIDADVFYFEGEKSADAAFYFSKVKNPKPVKLFQDGYGLIVDAVLGTGLNKEVEGVYLEVIKKINQSDAAVLSCDIASGLNGDSGEVMGEGIKADYTVTFATPKTGHYLGWGRELSGRIEVVDIGVKPLDSSVALLQERDIAACFKPLGKSIHKGDSGSTGIIGGSRNFVGAVALADFGRAALRTGAGLNHIAFPDFLYDALAARVIEGILHPIKTENGTIAYDKEIIDKFAGLDAVAFGMGLGRCAYTDSIIAGLLAGRAKLLIDADGLNTMDFERFDGGGKTLITPHPKELSNLTGLSIKEILSRPIEIARRIAVEKNLVVLLKGAATVITDGQRTVINTFGTPAMAKGGSGDLLAGIITGLAARGFSLFESAYAGAGLAGIAAELAVESGNEFSVLPSDSARYIPAAINKILGVKP